jgi:DNA-binding NarL/FixJ family response regulator
MQERRGPIRVLSTEDHPVFGEGLRTIISHQEDMVFVGRAVNFEESLRLYRQHHPDIVLMDLRLPGKDGITAIEELRKNYPEVKVIVLSTSDNYVDIQRSLRVGAVGYMLKSMSDEEIVHVIRTVYSRGRYIPPQIGSQIAEHFGDEQLTDRELDVLGLIRDGHRNKQIADRLNIAETTVNYHIKNIVEKLNANDRTHAVTIAVRRGLLVI